MSPGRARPLPRGRIFGHRGAKAVAPENTLASFHRALRDGAVGLEFDLRESSDGEIFVIHDAHLERTTNGRGALCDHTAEELASMDAGSWFAPEFRGEKIPRLDEVLDTFLGKTLLDLELKIDLGDRALQHLATKLAPSRAGGVFATSFSREALASFASRLPWIPRGLLLDATSPLPESEDLRREGIQSILADASRIDADFAAQVREVDFPLHTYTVNEPNRALELWELGVDIVITDHPKRLRDECGESSAGRESPPAGV